MSEENNAAVVEPEQVETNSVLEQTQETIVEDNTTEAIAEVEEKAPERAVSRALAIAARKDRELRKQRTAFAAEQAQVQEQLKEVQAYKAQLAQAKQNPMLALEAAGLGIQDLNEWMLTGDIPKPDVSEQLAEIRQELDNRDRMSREKEIKQELASIDAQSKQLIDNFHTELATHLDAGADKYPLIHGAKLYDVVAKSIKQHLHITGRLLSNAEGAEMVETELASLVKLAANPTKTGEALVETEQKNSGDRVKQPSSTLTNDLARSTGTQGDSNTWNTAQEFETKALAIIRRLEAEDAALG